jgi:hypothetical protein
MIQRSSTSFRKKSVITFIVTLSVSLYWYLSQIITVYRLPLIGALYELFWVGMVMALFGLPVFSFIHWIKAKFNPRSLYLYSFIISLISILLLITLFE